MDLPVTFAERAENMMCKRVRQFDAPRWLPRAVTHPCSPFVTATGLDVSAQYVRRARCVDVTRK
ncbi:hypothetical protein HaLaN_16703, partial [Haematococcus lacustris]